jgi:hypothetical protein
MVLFEVKVGVSQSENKSIVFRSNVNFFLDPSQSLFVFFCDKEAHPKRIIGV